MPIFHTKQNTVPPPPAQSSPPNRSRSLFSRNRSQSPVYDNSTTSSTNGNRGGLFSRRRSPSPEDYSTRATTGSSGGFFSRRRSSSSSSSNGNRDLRRDPTISAARAKVAEAEASERAADSALAQARASVKEAREHARILEREAIDEYVYPVLTQLPKLIFIQGSSCKGEAGRGKDRQ